MDLQYFKDRIEDELCGSKEYVKRAIEIKPMSPAWGKTLLAMSATELEHAKSLYGMFQEYYKKITETYETIPKYVAKGKKRIDEMFVECSAKIKYMHSMYE